MQAVEQDLQSVHTHIPPFPWAARYNTWLLIKLTPKGVVFSFLFFFYFRFNVHRLPDQSVHFC